MNELESSITILNANLEKKGKEIQKHLSDVKTKDVEELKRKHSILTTKNKLSESIREETNTLSSAVGDEKKLEELINNFSELTPDKIDADIELNEEKLAKIKPLKDESVENIGEIKNQLGNLSSNEDLILNQSELEINKTLLNDNAHEWVKSQIALKVLDGAISKFEETRQPDVINVAKSIFSQITDSKYPSIQMQAETKELVVIDSDNNIKKVQELSRGTLEELYLSMRLGLIEEYEKYSEPMPFIMDDTFVNFDDSRRIRAVETLNSFATDRQVIVLTCHEEIMNLYRGIDANVITF